MRFELLLPKSHKHKSILWHESALYPGVRYGLRSISLMQRLQLLTRGRDLSRQSEFQRAGTDSDQLEAAISDLAVQRMYIEWGVSEIRGLTIDGSRAGVHELLESGPEALCEEIFEKLQEQLGLTQDERKNS